MFDIKEIDYMSLLEYSSIVEIESCRFAAQRASKEDIHKIEECYLQNMKNLKNDSIDLEVNMAFHLPIARASKNSIFYLKELDS
jgi:GntR family transcriptional repressor for pyruvate dehydrogenase complex